jgi:polar amino acid transport system substrate-binding protein
MISTTVRAQLAPLGSLRVGINYGNAVLASRDPVSGELTGVAVDLARELGRRAELAVNLVAFAAAGQMVTGLKTGAWDVAFLAAEPGRAGEIAFTPPYILIEGTYLVPPQSALQALVDVDSAGVRVGVSTGSAYQLFLSRNLQYAELVRADTPNGAFDLLIQGKVDVIAGVRQALVAHAAKLPGARVFAERFMAIEQAMGMAQGRAEALAYLSEFIEAAKASGLVAQALEKAGVRGVSVAPPASA